MVFPCACPNVFDHLDMVEPCILYNLMEKLMAQIYVEKTRLKRISMMKMKLLLVIIIE
jgi:hypothetical protein